MQCITVYNYIVIVFKTIYIIHTVQKQTWDENDKFKFHFSDEINGDLFLLEEAESIRRMA